MIILVNFSKNPFKIQYRSGSKAFVKTIPTNKVVAMKGLREVEQITNRNALAKLGITIYHYETSSYFHDNGRPFTNLPFIFIGDNIKPSSISNVNLGFTGTTSASGATFTKAGATAPTVYQFSITANTAGTAGVITATTVGNNIFIGFKAPTTSAELVSGLTANTSYNSLGIATTGGNGTGISASTFYLSATTALPESSYYAYLQSLVG